jgi:SAM-dependent methyltransferase
MATDNRQVESYYDDVALMKLSAFIRPNPRVEAGWESLAQVPCKPGAILEIGCGIGDVSYRLGLHFRDAHVVGLDISSRSIGIAERMFSGPNVSFVAGELNAISEGCFDLVVMLDVFEHIRRDDRQAFMTKLSTLISSEAFIFASCPSPECLAWLRRNAPERIQPVDEDITLEVVSELAACCSKRLWLYKTVSIWSSGDYFHVLLGPAHGMESLGHPSEVRPPRPTVFQRLMRRVPPHAPSAETSRREERLEVIRRKMGDEVAQQVLRLLK